MAERRLKVGQAARDPKLLGASIKWYPAQLELLDSLDQDDGLHIWAIGRQAGKTSLAAVAAVHNAALRPDLDRVLPKHGTRYVLVAAASEQQSKEFVGICAGMIEQSPLLRDKATVQADRIRFALPRVDADGKRWTAKVVIRAMTSSSRTTRGLSASMLILDEFAHLQDVVGPAGDAALYAALTPSLKVFGSLAKTLVISTPSGRSGMFFELYEKARSGVLASAQAWQASVLEIKPDADQEWLDQQRLALGEGVYAQEYLAEFVDAGGSFFDLSEVEFADAPAAPEDGEGWIAALDPAFHGDSFGVVLIGRSRFERDLLLVGVVGAIKPQGAAKSFDARRSREDATLAAVAEMIAPYAPTKIVSDQHQSSAISSFFGRRGMQVQIVNLSRALQTQAFVSLRARLVDGSLRCPGDPRLVDELRRVRAKDTETVHLPRFGDSHCDVAAALALGVSQAEMLTLVPAMAVMRGGAVGSSSRGRYSTSEFG